MSDEQQKEKRPLSMTRRYRRGLVIVGLLCMMVTLAIATVLFQRSYTVRVDKYLSQICDSVAAGYKAQPTHDAVTLANLLPESDTSLRFSLIDGGGTVLYDSEAAAGVVYDKDGKVYAVDAPDLPSHADRPEFIAAMADGSASATRESLTMQEETHYYARRIVTPEGTQVLRVGEDAEKTYQALERLRFDWLAAPGLEDAKVMSFIKTLRNGGRGVKAVVANATAPDCEGIVNLCVSGLTLEDGAMEAKDYAVRVAALLAALPLTRSATYVNLPEVVGCDALAEPDADVDAGKLIIVPGREGYRLGRAVNSLTTLTPDKAAPFQKIKIVEGIDLIRGDIAKAFESGYVGKVLNDYDNKLLLVTAINAYLKGLEGDVLDKTADNRCFVSLSGQRSYLESRGTDTSDMKDTDILKANTGSQVFLEAKLTFCDAMEDLALVISM